MLGEFRALGGVAENIAPGRGSFGRVLFQQDPAKPFLLRVPDNLLFSVKDVEFANGAIRIKKNAGVAAAERDFFERYQRAFSWGGGGQRESANFIAAVGSLPPRLRALLSTDFEMRDFLEGGREPRTQSRFLHSRAIEWNGADVLVPLIELANHGTDGSGYCADPQNGLQIQGCARGEILVDYGRRDSFDIFRAFGFAIARPCAYSRPLKAKVGTADLVIAGKSAGIEREDCRIPEMQVKGGAIFLSHLMIGNADSPGLSRGIFCALMREAGTSGAELAFDVILYANRGKFLNLLETLEPHRGEMITMLRRMAHFQLEAMAHSVGTREL
jgi:hypothetical protein